MNRTIRTLVGLAASAAMALSVVALAPSSASAATSPKGPYTVLESPGLTVHAGPGSATAALKTVSKGLTVSVDCWVIGWTTVNGDAVWGHVASGTGYGWVADYWLDLQGRTLQQTTLPQCTIKGSYYPGGYFDELSAKGTGSSRSLTVKGWAADYDTLNTSVHVVAYIFRGSTFVKTSEGIASGSRPDVHKAYPYCSNNTGFSYSISLPNAAATYTVKMYAMDTGSGLLYPLLDSPKTITVK